mmetsp:Transcript_6739/g.10305  ORF Transcript_6739/g.10305 Transcript_6739/m.10305 type:complete len:202 (+) Transcript_6739:112-717(+)
MALASISPSTRAAPQQTSSMLSTRTPAKEWQPTAARRRSPSSGSTARKPSRWSERRSSSKRRSRAPPWLACTPSPWQSGSRFRAQARINRRQSRGRVQVSCSASAVALEAPCIARRDLHKHLPSWKLLLQQRRRRSAARRQKPLSRNLLLQQRRRGVTAKPRISPWRTHRRTWRAQLLLALLAVVPAGLCQNDGGTGCQRL